MSLHQYIGARYVPKFYENSLGTAEWEGGVIYEALTIVTYNNNSYTSKKTVPANIGDPSSNPDYWAPTGIFSAAVSQLQTDVSHLLKNECYYYAEMAGAVGDGVTDDTAAIQAAINTCISNGYVLRFKKEHTYVITDLIQINDYVSIEGNGATIRADAAMSYMFYYLIYPKYDTSGYTDVWHRIDIEMNGYMRDIRLDCNDNAENGVHTSGYLIEYSGINVINVKKSGIVCGGISRIVNCNVSCLPVSGSVGIDIVSNDNFIDMIAVVDAEIAFKIGGYNRIQHCTAWIKTPEQYPGSVFAYDVGTTNSEVYELIECYADTYQIMFKADRRLHDPKFIGCRYQHNDAVSGSDTGDSYILYGVNADDSWFPNVVFTDCVFIGKSNNYTQIYNTSGARANFETNNTFIHLAKVKDNIYNRLTPPAGVTANNLRVVKEGTLTLVSFDVTINVPNTDASSNFNIVTLGTLTGYTKPLTDVNFMYGIRTTGNNEYYVTRFFGGKINATNGKIMIMIPSDLMTETGLRATGEIVFMNPTIHTAALTGFLNDNT